MIPSRFVELDEVYKKARALYIEANNRFHMQGLGCADNAFTALVNVRSGMGNIRPEVNKKKTRQEQIVFIKTVIAISDNPEFAQAAAKVISKFS